MPGYAGGITSNPTYEEVSSGETGHAEVVKIEFNPTEITYETLLDIFFELHDPTTLNQQGADIGTQYRSIILYTSAEQKVQAEKSKNKIPHAVTEIKELDNFYPAENYHKNYYENHTDLPYCQIIISPKLNKLRQDFKALISST